MSIFFLLDNSFRLHFARGQTYVLLLLFTVVVADGMRRGNPGWLAPLAFSFLILFRPTYVIVAAASILGGHRKLFARTTAAFLFIGALSLTATGVRPWLDYARFVEQQAQGHLALATGRSTDPTPASITIEGVDSRRFLHLGGVQDQTFIGLGAHVGLARVLMLKHQHALMMANNVFLLVFALLGLLVARATCNRASSYMTIAWIFLLPFDLESFGPQRYPYADVLLLLPVAMVMFALLEFRAQSPKGALVGFAALASISAILSRIPIGPISVISTIRFMAIVLALNMICIVEIVRATKKKQFSLGQQRLDSNKASVANQLR
ncbi:MAG TPA: hypothetical protein VFU86_12055 [Terriglobales bacterium]|nr:hypothetical protein [Terriglobales bacterium]